VFEIDDRPAVDLVGGRHLCYNAPSERVSRDVEVFKVMSLPVMIQRCITEPIRAQLVQSF